MAILLDTDVAIHIRDGAASVIERLVERGAKPHLSLATLVELHGGMHGPADLVARRSAGLQRLLDVAAVTPLDPAVVERYGLIVRRLGFARTRVFDRLIAATALVHDLTLVTINGGDFRDIPDLKLEVWPSPSAQ